MSESIQILIIAASLATGSITIIFAYRLMKQYRLSYLSTFFYFIIFLFVFSIYSIIGSNTLHLIISGPGINETSIQNIRLFIIFLGVPFIILTWYMFYKFCRELTGYQLSPVFNLVFFGFQSLLLAGYVFFLIRIVSFGDDLYDLAMRLMIIVYSAITVIIALSGLVHILLTTVNEHNRKVKKNLRILGYMYVFFFIIQAALLNFSRLFPSISVIFIFILISYHIFPILFLNIFLDNNYIAPEIAQSLEDLLEGFVSRYGISKRETEIIEQIFTGKSNQEISDSLFISLQTVKDHIHRIYLKTGVRNRVQLSNLIRDNHS